MTRLDDVRARHAARLRTRAAKGDGETQMSTLVDDDVAWLLGEVTRLQMKGIEDCRVLHDYVNDRDIEIARLTDAVRHMTESWETAEDAIQANGRVEALIDAAEKRSPIGAAYDRAHPDEPAAVLISTRDLRAALAPGAPDAEHAEPKHIGGRANAEDCPACAALDLPYPWICPGDSKADPC